MKEAIILLSVLFLVLTLKVYIVYQRAKKEANKNVRNNFKDAMNN